ncbi:hypothetical protein BGX31_001292 [Mortierella sp. GBA43]|nr:hypothetical protein BGX31_001292 [Mortierella sp. GBA43]
MPPPGLKVLISGAGIAGLTLAVLLERAGIDYEVYERAATVRPLGSVLALGPSVLAMIEQIGLLERLKELSKENDVVSNYTEELELTSTIDYTVLPERAGYPNYVIARTALYDLLYSQIPKGKVHMQKRVESIQQGEGEDDLVTITFTDKTTAQGHILVGADGAYSGVRKSLFEQLHQQGKLPLSDNEEMPCTSLCLVGQTRPLSTEKFPHLNDKYCEFENITGTNKPFTVRKATTVSLLESKG